MLIATACSASNAAPIEDPGVAPIQSAAPVAATSPAVPSSSAIVLRTITVEPDQPGFVGVVECDQYLTQWRNCYIDPTTRAAVEPALQEMAKTWKQQASEGPEQRAALVDACRTMINNFPVQSCESSLR